MFAITDIPQNHADPHGGTRPRHRAGAGLVFGALLLLAASALVGAGVFWLWRPLPPLLARARRVTPTAGWDTRGWDGNGPPSYAWLSNHEVLFARPDPRDRSGGLRHLIRRDVGTGVEAPLGSGRPTHQPLRASDTLLSPDGRWLLLRDWTNGATHGVLIAVALDGSGRRKTGPVARPGLNLGTSGGVPFWLPSGAGWAWVGQGGGRGNGQGTLTVFPLGNGNIILALSGLPPHAAQNALGLIRQNDDDARRPAVLALGNDRSLSPFWFHSEGGDNRFFLVDGGAGGGANRNPALAPPRSARPALRLLVVRPGTAQGAAAAQAALQTYRVLLPPGTVSGSVIVSPNGRQLAWLLDTERRSPVAELLVRLVPTHPLALRPPRRSVSLWTSNVDGSDFACVGAYASPPPRPVPAAAGRKVVLLADSRPGRLPSRLRWTPDGRRLSFVFDGALWTVPAKRKSS